MPLPPTLPMPPPPVKPVATASSMQEPAAAGGAAVPSPHTEIKAPLPPRPRKRPRHNPGPSQLSRSLFDASQPMRGYTFSFRVRFLDPSKRLAQAAATEAIKRALCAWGGKQRFGFTLDARENGPCLEGVIEGVDNGVVSEFALETLKKRVYDHLARGKQGSALNCYYNMSFSLHMPSQRRWSRAGLPGKESGQGTCDGKPRSPGPPSSLRLGLRSCLRDPSLPHLSRPPRRSKGTVCCALRCQQSSAVLR